MVEAPFRRASVIGSSLSLPLSRESDSLRGRWSFETNSELQFKSFRDALKQLEADATSAGFDPCDRGMTHAGALGHFAL
jgi:hypothetical protein